ncbi:hypothetical protein [Nocardioides convexus]|uniref:hypothetical protein n=1 Tax=Nocardioides convexus TaxID=2712224 RepID=UPI0024186801|nr:hypothetical protein [Nocardioides convexus]
MTTTVMALGYLLFTLTLSTDPSYLGMVLPALVLIGIGWVGFPAINIQATSGIEDDEQGLAAGVLQTSMQVGAAIVLAITTAIIRLRYGGGDHTGGAARRLPAGPGLRDRGVRARRGRGDRRAGVGAAHPSGAGPRPRRGRAGAWPAWPEPATPMALGCVSRSGRRTRGSRSPRSRRTTRPGP